MIGALIRKYWPGFYTTVPNGEKILATRWSDYKLAPAVGYLSAADAVVTRFWVRRTLQISCIVDDSNLLTHDSHNYFLCVITEIL